MANTVDGTAVTFTQSIAGGVVTETLGGTASETATVTATGTVPLIADDGTTFNVALTVTNPRTFPLTPATSGLHTFKMQAGTFTLSDGRVATVQASGLSFTTPQ